jgi:hypothetical protein
LILTVDYQGNIENVNTATCFKRLHSWLIMKVIGKQAVLANIQLSMEPSDEFFADAQVPGGLFCYYVDFKAASGYKLVISSKDQF